MDENFTQKFLRLYGELNEENQFKVRCKIIELLSSN